MRYPAIRLLHPAGALLLLAACGGGGGGDDDPAPQPNRNPALVTTTVAATEDTTFTGQLTATDADNNTLTFARVTDVQHGTLTVSGTGAITYAPTANYSGADSFSVRVTDGAGGETTGTVAITVAAVNDAPVLTSTQFTTAEDTPLVATLTATDADGNTVTFTGNAGVAHGALAMNNSGAFTYTPLPDYHGADGFTVTVSDGAGGQVTANVAFTVTSVNDAPVLTTTTVTVNEDSTLTTQLTAVDADGDNLTFSLDTGASRGVGAISASGQLTYTPSPNYHGGDIVIARVTDGVAAVNTQVAITVTSVNVPPVANDDEFRIATGAPRTFAVIANDTESEGEALTVTIRSQPSGGTVSVGANNLLTFTPENGFTGPIDFEYRLTDARGGFDDANVRALIGDFQGVLYLSDELNPGRPEILLFDGLDTTLVASPPAGTYEIVRFSVSGNGTRLAYVVSGPQVDRVYFKALDAPGNGTLLWDNFNASQAPTGTQNLALNHSGSYLWALNRYIPGPKRHEIINTANGARQLLGADEASVVQTSQVQFNPGNDTQIVVQGQVGGTTPPNGFTEYFTLFTADAAAPRTLDQVGATNAPGTGSGYSALIGGNGRYIYHGEVTGGPPPTPFLQTLLVWDNTTQTESVMYRRPMGTERGMGGIFNIAFDGSQVCFAFGEVNNVLFIGPAAFHVGSGASPAAANAVTTQFNSVTRCWFSSGNGSLVMSNKTASGNGNELYSMDLVTLAAPVKLTHAMGAGEELSNTFVARQAPRVIAGYRTAPATDSRLYVIPAAGGAERLFASNFPNLSSQYDNINGDGTLLAYAAWDGARLRLRLMSTQTLDYSLPVTPDDAALQRGVGQFTWLPVN